MPDLFDLVTEQLKGQAAEQIGRQFGIGSSGAEKAMPGAISAIIAALAGNSRSTGGASALGAALDRDHDGSVLDDLGGFLSNSREASSTGDAILGHVFGGRRPQVESQLSQTTGLDSAAVSQMLATLAPIVLGALGKAKRAGGLDEVGLSSMLQQERAQLSQKAPTELSGLAALLDSDGDGDIKDDLGRMGSSLLKNLLNKR